MKVGEKVPLYLRAYIRLTQQQTELMGKIHDTIKSVNSVNPLFHLSEIDRMEQQFIALQEDAIRIERLNDQPLEFLTPQEKANLSNGQIMELMGGFITKIDNKQALVLSERIFTLLEHLERRISDKRSRVYFYRMAAVGLIAIVISLVSLIRPF